MAVTTHAFPLAPAPLPVSGGGDRSPELALHALAQLPAAFRLELGPTPSKRLIHRVALAYGIRERLLFDSDAVTNAARFRRESESIDLEALVPATLGEIVETLGEGSGNVIDESSDTALSGHRVVLVTNYPAHYRTALFQQMARRLADVGAGLYVVFLAAEARSRSWLTESPLGFQHETLSSLQVPGIQRGPVIPFGLSRTLRRLKPSIVLAGGFSPLVSGSAARIAREMKASFGLWSGETQAIAATRQSWREPSRRHLAASGDFAIAYGTRALAYLRELAPELPVVLGRNTSPSRAIQRSRARSSDDAFRLLLIGDLASPRKGADIALDAMTRVSTSNVRLDIVGGGRLEADLASGAAADPRIRLLGALAPGDVARQLRDADALLFPTRSDIFGLVLVEAMAAGLAAIVSRAAGAVDDLAVDGYNAVVVDGQEPAIWAGAIDSLASDRARAEALGRRARQTIEARWTIAHATDAMVAGLRLGALAKARSPG